MPRGTARHQEAPGSPRGPPEAPEGSRKPREVPGGPRRPQEAPGGTRKRQEAAGGPGRPQEATGGTRRPQEAPESPKRPQEAPGTPRRPQEILGSPREPQEAGEVWDGPQWPGTLRETCGQPVRGSGGLLWLCVVAAGCWWGVRRSPPEEARAGPCPRTPGTSPENQIQKLIQFFNKPKQNVKKLDEKLDWKLRDVFG